MLTENNNKNYDEHTKMEEISNDCFDYLLQEIKNAKITQSQKFWLLLKFLEILQNEKNLTSECKKRFNDTHKLSQSSATALDYKINKKYQLIFLYLDFLKSVISFFTKKMEPFLETEFSDSDDDYLVEVLFHFISGNPWTDDASIRSNYIDKTERAFRGFSKKSIRKKNEKNSKK